MSGRLDHIVILTGAGISAASGIATFRGAGGLWRTHSALSLATPEAFAADPGLVHAFYNERRAKLADVEPNAGHFALARLQAAYPGRVTLITQNVDDLHQRAGSGDVLQMHGALRRGYCTLCETRMDWQGDMQTGSACPACGAPGGMRPDIVWFGEVPHGLHKIAKAMADVDLFVSIGTSGAVYPAAGFLDQARACGAASLEINLEPSERSHLFDESRLGTAEDLVPLWVSDLLRK